MGDEGVKRCLLACAGPRGQQVASRPGGRQQGPTGQPQHNEWAHASAAQGAAAAKRGCQGRAGLLWHRNDSNNLQGGRRARGRGQEGDLKACAEGMCVHASRQEYNDRQQNWHAYGTLGSGYIRGPRSWISTSTTSQPTNNSSSSHLHWLGGIKHREAHICRHKVLGQLHARRRGLQHHQPQHRDACGVGQRIAKACVAMGLTPRHEPQSVQQLDKAVLHSSKNTSGRRRGELGAVQAQGSERFPQ